jgi:glycosyltransferase involved in cell wall biosynthesis
VTDARIQRHAGCFFECGWDVLLIGRKKKNSLPLPKKFYNSVRFSITPEKGMFFYLFYQIRLFVYLIRNAAPDLYFSNDTDTLLPVFLASKIKKVPFFFDSHELFWEVPELEGKFLKQNLWKWIEKMCIPLAKASFTVNDSIARILKDRYHREFQVIRNISSEYDTFPISIELQKKISSLLEKSGNRKILLYQGSGINIHRGLEEMLEAMELLKDEFVLWLAGGGDVWEKLKNRVDEKKLENSVFFIEKVPRGELNFITRNAHVGLSLDKPINKNYINSLPNKVFDYIHAGIPLISSKIREIENIISKYEIGITLSNHDPECMASEIKNFMNSLKYDKCKENVILAQKELKWDNEKKILIEQIKKLDNDSNHGQTNC